MPNLFKKLSKTRWTSQAIFVVVIITIFFVGAKYALAEDAMPSWVNWGTGTIGGAISLVLGIISYVITAVIGFIITVLVKILIQVAQYNNIINVPTVITGWVIIRDLCNMSFILILLVIAFATILRQENYSAKRLLPKLLIMAVLINFSRTIFGLLIDFSQVIMLTFVNAFAAGGGWFMDAFRVDKWFTINTVGSAGTKAADQWGIIMAMIAGVIAAIITLIVIAVILAILVMRIVMLWIYTILSPLVFLGFAFPPLQKYTGRIWEDFTKQLVVGPVLAFFIWLALTTAVSSSNILSGNLTTEQICVGVGAFFCEGNLQKFIIVIGLLMGGLMVAQQAGGAAGAIAGKGLAWAKKVAAAPGRAAMGVGRGAAGRAVSVADWGARKVKMGAVSELLAKKQIVGKDAEGRDIIKWKGRAPGLGGLASALYGLEVRPTRMIQGFREGLKAKAEREESQATGASAVSLKKGGIGGLIKGLGVSRDLTENLVGPGGFLWHKGFKRVFKGTVGGGEEKLSALEAEINKKKASRGVTQVEYDAKERENEENSRRKYDELQDTERRRDDATRLGDNAKAVELNTVWLKQRQELDEMSSNNRNELRTMKNNIVKPEVQKSRDEEIGRLERDLRLRTPMQTFYADRAREKLVSEASRTLGDNDNEEFLVDAFQGALINGNKEVAQAVTLHAASVGHLNEIIQGYKSKRDVFDKSGRLLVKAGEALCQGGYGLNELVKQALIEDLGVDEQTAYMTQSEASTLAKGVKHSNLSESVGSRNGLLFQREVEGEGGQQYRARGEARKVDAERFARDYNRLAWGDEFEIVKADGKKKRVFKLNALGLDNFTELAATLNQEAGERGRFNKNAAMNIAQDAETLRAWAKKLDEKGLKFLDKLGAESSYIDLAEKVIKYGESIAQAQRQDKEAGGINVKAMQDEVLKAQERPT